MTHKKRILLVNEASFFKTGYSKYGRELLKELYNTNKYELAELGTHACPWIKEHVDEVNSLPWKFYFNVPHKDSPEFQKFEKSGKIGEFGGFKFEDVCLDFQPDVVCVPPGELVLTENGYKKIETINVGEKVLTHKGRFKRVTKTFKNQHIGDLITIKFNCCKEPLRLTGEHPVLIFEKKNRTTKKRTVENVYKDEQPIFKEAKNLKAGDVILLPILSIKNKNTKIRVSEYITQYIEKDGKLECVVHKSNIHYVNNEIKLDQDFGTILGYLIGDGTTTGRGGINFFFHGDELRFVEDALEKIEKVFGVRGSFKKSKDKNMYTVFINSSILNEFFTKLDYKKYLWENEDFVRGIIKGWIRADGCYKTKTVSLTTVNRDMAHLFRYLCLLLKINTCLHKKTALNTNTGNYCTSYDIEGYGESAEKLHTLSKKHKKHNKLIPAQSFNNSRGHFNKNNFCVKISRVRKSPYRGQVYNLEVEDDNSYIVQQSCVHNCDIRDYWFTTFAQNSPYRNIYKYAWMPTCDSAPQPPEWLSACREADAVFTYNDWSKSILEQSGVSVLDSCPPSCSTEFQPLNKQAIRKEFELGDITIIGTVMRNQRRKLFSDLFKSFREFLNQAKRPDIFLLAHTSYPDKGWDIPAILLEHGVSNKVLFTYVCEKCRHSYIDFYSDTIAVCPKCNSYSAHLPSVKCGLGDEQMSKVFNCMDLYVQYSNCEGFGVPSIEAAACGVPVMEVDYSAMKDVVRKLNGIPIPVLHLNQECETGTYKAIPDNNAFVKQLLQYALDKKYLRHLGELALRGYKEHYQWDLTAARWMKYFDLVPKADWKKQPRILEPSQNVPNCNNKDFARWLITDVLREPERSGSYFECRLIRDLMYGHTKGGLDGVYYNEDSLLFQNNEYKKFDRKVAYDMIINLVNNRNFLEHKRGKHVGIL